MLDLKVVPRHPLVAASILSADFGRMAEDCRDVLSKGADLLHIDVMDGHFVPNLTMGGDMVKGVRMHLPDTFLDCHLMVTRPDMYVEQFAAAGANMFSFHVEVCRSFTPGGVDGFALIEAIHKAGMLAGIVVNPGTSVEHLQGYLGKVDNVLIMSVVPGKSGQAFMSEVLPKVRWAKARVGAQTRVEMDGGVSPKTVGACVAAGADLLVTASALFGASDRKSVIDAFHAAKG
jgi:ribulose-phosphate 3-epimerase